MKTACEPGQKCRRIADGIANPLEPLGKFFMAYNPSDVLARKTARSVYGTGSAQSYPKRFKNAPRANAPALATSKSRQAFLRRAAALFAASSVPSLKQAKAYNLDATQDPVFPIFSAKRVVEKLMENIDDIRARSILKLPWRDVELPHMLDPEIFEVFTEQLPATVAENFRAAAKCSSRSAYNAVELIKKVYGGEDSIVFEQRVEYVETAIRACQECKDALEIMWSLLPTRITTRFASLSMPSQKRAITDDSDPDKDLPTLFPIICARRDVEKILQNEETFREKASKRMPVGDLQLPSQIKPAVFEMLAQTVPQEDAEKFRAAAQCYLRSAYNANELMRMVYEDVNNKEWIKIPEYVNTVIVACRECKDALVIMWALLPQRFTANPRIAA
jgi:hypothetical protein